MLNIENLSKTFESDGSDTKVAVEHLNLGLLEEEFVVVIGTRGSGKSTLLNLIAGRLASDEGKIILDRKNVTAWSEHQRSRLVGMVCTDPREGTAENMTVAENLALAMNRQSWSSLSPLLSRRKLNLICDYLKEFGEGFGLENHLHQQAGTLSLGQRQVLALLMAGIGHPKLLLLDEHTEELSPEQAGLVMRATNRLIKRYHLSTIMVTQSMRQAIRLGDRLLLMHHGHIFEEIPAPVKKHLRIADLSEKFEELRRQESLDAGTAEMLEKLYV